MSYEIYMNEALKCAENGIGRVNPNPLVGAIIAKNGNIIARGWHHEYGAPHAEIDALANCTEDPKGASLYVNLEPCCHYGKTPPCTDAIIKSGIGHVIIGAQDTNHLVRGRGIKILEDNGIKVTLGVLEDECEKINEIYFHYIRRKKPFVIMKSAMTTDGKIATRYGDSKWITGEAARLHVHKERNRYSAVMVGVGTVIKDNPYLTCRIPNGNNPVRIICDSNLRTPLESNIVKTAKEVPTIIATCKNDALLEEAYIKYNCRIIHVSQKDGRVNLIELLDILGKSGIDSIIIEGGGTLNWAAIQSGIVNKVQTYIAPKLFGGTSALTPLEGLGVNSPNNAIRIGKPTITQLGDDILFESEVL